MSVMNRAQFAKQLQLGLNAIFGMAYRELTPEWTQVFPVESSSKAYEEDVLMTGFGAAQVKAEGSAISYDEGAEGWSARYEHITIALAFAITEEAQEDNLYTTLGPKYAKALARAMAHTKEIYGANVLNNAFSTSYLGGDGKALLADDHPLLGGGTFSNMLATPADLSETAIEDLLIQVRKAKDDRGVPIALSPTGLILPPELEYTAHRILQSPQRVATANNDINAIKSKGIFGKAPVVITRLTSASNWFLKTDCLDGLKHFKRKGITRGTEVEFSTGNISYKSRERYSFGWTDPRSLYGSGS